MSGIFGSLFGGGKRKASQPADASGRAAAMSSRTGPGPSSWTGPPPRDPKEWRGPHNPTRSRGTKTDADADASGPPRSVMDLTRDEAPPSSSPRAARAAAREERRASRRDRRTEAENTDDAEAANAHPQEDPVLEECPHGTVQGVPDTDTVVDEDGDEANDFLYADPPPPSFAGFVDLTLEDRVANDDDDDDDDDETSSAGVIRASPTMRCAGCRADVRGRPDVAAASWRVDPGVGRWRGRCAGGGGRGGRRRPCAVVLCGACLGERATRALTAATRALTTGNDGDEKSAPGDGDGGGVGGGVPAIACPTGCGGRLVDAPVAEAGDPDVYNAWAAAATDALLGVGPKGRGDTGGGTASKGTASNRAHPGTSSSSSFARCPNPACGVAIEKVPPRRNPDGDLELVAERIPGTARWMSREALEHRAAKLFRCGACGTDFCGDCDAMPYHVGFASCAAAAAAAKAPRCRYCRERITPGASALDFYYFGGGGGDEESAPGDLDGDGRGNDAVLAPAGKSGDMSVRELRRACGAADTSWCVDKKELRGVFRIAGGVCRAGECQSRLEGSCTKTLSCGHPCGGVRGEATCLPCLRCAPPGPGDAGATREGKSRPPTADDPCAICYVDPLGAAPAILLGCGHVVHRQCAIDKIRAGWPGPAISFNHLRCPLCGASGGEAEEVGSAQFPVMRHGSLDEEIRPVLALRDVVMRRGRRRLLAEGNVAELRPGGEWEGRPGELALQRFNYYKCGRCGEPYFGGLRECGGEPGGGGGDANGDAELMCGGCSATVSGLSGACAKHGRDELQFKCRFCCSPAVFFCFGSTHFCERCHVTRPDFKPQPPPKTCTKATCPLGVDHPPHGQEFCLGCALCRATDTGY